MLTPMERAVLDQMKPRKASVPEDHTLNCLQCLRHRTSPTHYEKCFAAEWWQRQGKHPDTAADRRFPDYIAVMESKRPRWVKETDYVVVIGAVSSQQLWLYSHDFEHLVYHCCSDIE